MIHTDIGNIKALLSQLTKDAKNLRTASTIDHVRNQLGKGDSKVNKLVASSIQATLHQIEIIHNELDLFFKDNQEKDNVHKRALEILGSFLSTMTGVPSARDHRKVLEQVRALKLDSGEIRGLLKQQNIENRDILETFHFQENTLRNLTSKVSSFYALTRDISNSVERTLAVVSMTSKINAALESARIAISHAKAIMASDKHSHLSRYAISPSQLSSIINSITIKRQIDLPIFTGENSHNYFNQPLAHSWVSNDKTKINTLLQIPIAHMHHKNELLLLNQLNKQHSDLPFAVVNKELNLYRFLSMSDYSKCLNAENAIICQKREITIMPRVGCSLKRDNCEQWAADAVHDISNTEIMIMLNNSITASVSCDGMKTQRVVLPTKAVITLNLHCSLNTDSFSIAKVNYRQLRELDFTEQNSKISFDLEHKALAAEMTENIASHAFSKENRNDIDSLIKKNERFQDSLEQQEIVASAKWAQFKGDGYPWDLVCLWILVSLLTILLTITILWTTKLQIAAWKSNGMGGERLRQMEARLIRDFDSKVKNMLTDTHISMREALSSTARGHGNSLSREENNEPYYQAVANRY